MKHKRMTLTNKRTTVTVEFNEDAGLEEMLDYLEGILRAFGYRYDGKLGFVE